MMVVCYDRLLASRAMYSLLACNSSCFSYSDPVAYRIEPLLLPQGLDFNDLPPPAYLTVPGKDVRLHVKAKQVSDVIRKSLFDQKKSGWGSLLESAASALGNDAASSEATGGSKIEGGGIKLPTSFPLGGTSYNCRVDFSLQPGVIDNEYIRCVSSSFYRTVIETFHAILTSHHVSISTALSWHTVVTLQIKTF